MRWHSYNLQPGRSVLLGGAGPDTQLAGAEELGEALAPSMEDRLNQVNTLMVQLCNEATQLCTELEATKKGKEVDRGRRPRPGPLTNKFSVP